MDAVIVSVRLGKLILALQQGVESFPPAEFEYFVHLDGLEGANLDANLAAHADRDIDVKDRRIKLRLAHVIGLLVFALNNIDALRRAFLFADLAGHAAQARFRIIGVVNEEWKVAIVLRQRIALFRILHRYEPLLLEITSDKVPRCDRHSPEYARADHRVLMLPKRRHIHREKLEYMRPVILLVMLCAA